MASWFKIVNILNGPTSSLLSSSLFSPTLKNAVFRSRQLGCICPSFSRQITDEKMSTYSQYGALPIDPKKRRSLKLVLRERKRRFALSQPSIRRKKDAILKRFSDAKTKLAENVEHIIEKENIWTIPNILCIGRIIVCPYLGYLILDEKFPAACCLLIAAGVTDLLDGYIARNFQAQSSKLGSFLDPLADKILVSTVFLTLTYMDLLPVLLTSIIVSRDVCLAGAGFYIRYRSLPHPFVISWFQKTLPRYFDPSHATAQLAPTGISKVNTFVQLCTIFCTLSAPVFGFVGHPYLTGLWYLTGATTVLSAGSYIFSSNTYKFLKEANIKK